MKIKLPNLNYELTPLCNLNCRYCYNHWKIEDVKPHVSPYRVVLKTLKKVLKIANVKHITFTGGEPLLSDRFLELVLYVRMKGITVTVISNGNNTNEIYDQLVGLGVSLFELPVHSHNSQIHDYLTNHLGSWEKSINAITNLVKLKAEVVVVIVLTKKNLSEISKTLEYIKSLGISRVMVNRFNIGGQGISEISNLTTTREELSNAYKIISGQAKELDLSISSNVCSPICVINPHDYKNIRFSSCSFEFYERPITLDFNGNLRFCNHSPVVLGNIFEEPLGSILNSTAAAQWKNTKPQFCNNCKVYDRCKAGCRAASEQMGLSLNYPDPIIDYMGKDDELLKQFKS